MVRIIREVRESPLEQGIDEEIAYTLTTTSFGTAPSSAEVKAYDITENAYTDVTTTVLHGSVLIAGDVITLPTLKAITEGKTYRIEIKFTAGGQVHEPYLHIHARK
jgi:hypothetical protein